MGEVGLTECRWSAPDDSCSDHLHDAVLFCTSNMAEADRTEGGSRLLSGDNAPSTDGSGRLEVFMGGRWGTVCLRKVLGRLVLPLHAGRWALRAAVCGKLLRIAAGPVQHQYFPMSLVSVASLPSQPVATSQVLMCIVPHRKLLC